MTTTKTKPKQTRETVRDRLQAAIAVAADAPPVEQRRMTPGAIVLDAVTRSGVDVPVTFDAEHDSNGVEWGARIGFAELEPGCNVLAVVRDIVKGLPVWPPLAAAEIDADGLHMVTRVRRKPGSIQIEKLSTRAEPRSW